MYTKKYKSPLNLLVVFEKTPFVVFSSEFLTANHYLVVVENNWWYAINTLIRKDSTLNPATLIELSAIDTLRYPCLFTNELIFLKVNRLLLYGVYYSYLTKNRLTLISLCDNNCGKNPASIDLVYQNTSWLEREVSEMFGLFFSNKKDTRALLLDYSRCDNPLLKDFPSEGLHELYYDFFDRHLHYVNSDHIEL